MWMYVYNNTRFQTQNHALVLCAVYMYVCIYVYVLYYYNVICVGESK